MTICTVQFRYDNGPDYDELYRVFKQSLSINAPDIKVDTIFIDPPERDQQRSYAYKYNSVKLEKWVEYLSTAKEPVIFADCDMLLLRDCSHAFDVDFDVAFTQRVNFARIPMNGGIMMARPNQKSIDFFALLLDVNNRMYDDREFHKPWLTKYVGMNQAAFGYVYEECDHGANIHAYTTRQWNAVDSDWQHLDNNTVFLHIKGGLRRNVLQKLQPYGPMQEAMSLWYDYAGYEKEQLKPLPKALTRKQVRQLELERRKQKRRRK